MTTGMPAGTTELRAARSWRPGSWVIATTTSSVTSPFPTGSASTSQNLAAALATGRQEEQQCPPPGAHQAHVHPFTPETEAGHIGGQRGRLVAVGRDGDQTLKSRWLVGRPARPP